MRFSGLLAAVGVALAALAGCDAPNRVIARLPDPPFNSLDSRPVSPALSSPDRSASVGNDVAARPPEAAPVVPPTPSRPGAAPADPAWLRHAKDHDWQYIVIHHSATAEGNAASFDQGHRANGWDELGYHFVIGNGTRSGDGQIEVGPRWVKQKHGAHCKTSDNRFNDNGIGICLVGNFDQHYPTSAQMAGLRRLVAFLSDYYRIPGERIFGHRQAVASVGERGTGTACPGRYFNVNLARSFAGVGRLTAKASDYGR